MYTGPSPKPTGPVEKSHKLTVQPQQLSPLQGPAATRRPMADIIPGASVFRAALVGEAWANVLGAVPLVLFPRATLKFLLNDARAGSAGHEQLLQILGVVFAGLAVPLFKASAETPSGVALRRTTYLQLGTIEAILVGLLVPQLGNDSPGALKPSVLLGLLGVVGGALLWRVYSTLFNPDLPGWVISTSQHKKQD